MAVGIEQHARQVVAQQKKGAEMIKNITIIIDNMQMFQGRTMKIWRGQSIHQKHGVRQVSMIFP